MEKNYTQLKKAQNAAINAAKRRAEAIAENRATQFMWISRIFGALCFFFTATSALLSLMLLHLAGEAEANTFVVTSPTFSENLAYFEPLHADAPKMDTLAEMYVRQYVSVRHSVVQNLREMKVNWGYGGVIASLSIPSVYEKFATRYVKDIVDGKKAIEQTVEVDMKRIIKDGWNNWQVFFDTRELKGGAVEPVVTSWIATIQFRYFAFNAVMARRLKNPMGFTVMQYNVAKQKK